ncbi:cation:proton antiporter [Zavarzinia compransoris]|uniref:Sodium:proton antiporter n=1 Tax=Zavarzinia compransoris TaxID=1264899 RepID=A0A317DVP4_9PROT|nr:cation:proton antiporter [Zavarzinia compransoris]PWR18767.1 sodium:proton antiporter [Zavarzinia compransoris]TDP48751.1 sodium/proton antiporter (CPA1 family) [Zavarzinia compransoris]
MNTIVTTVFAIAGLLAVISLLPTVARRFGIPYSVVLALVGLGVGALSSAAGATAITGPVGDMLLAWRDFTSSSVVFMVVFLPILLFEASLGIDVRELFDDLVPVLLLAVVAVLVATAVVGFALSQAGPFGLIPCLLLASIISTTDPAAVVAIFRDLGAPKRLSLLVEGEAVFNDAAAITIFTMLIAALTRGQALDGLSGLWLFLDHFAVGSLFGLALGLLATWLVPYFNDNRLSELTITVGGAYLCYIVPESYFHASGVVSVVIFALTFGALGRMRIAPENWRHLHHSWQTLGFWANSLIFMLAAMLAPKTLATMTFGDFTLLLVLVGAALAARGLVIFGLMPVVTAIGLAHRVTPAYRAVIVWGGLRGAVTLALALAATENPLLNPELKRFIGVLATTFVLWTLLVNGLTLKPLIKLLGLDRLSPSDLATRDRVMTLSLNTVKATTEEVARTHRIGEEAVKQVTTYYERRLAELEVASALDQVHPGREDVESAGLVTLARREQAIYLDMFEHRVIGRDMVAPLVTIADRLADAARTGGQAEYLRECHCVTDFRPSFRLALFLQRRFGWNRPLALTLESRLERLLIMQAALRELVGYVRRTLAPVFGTTAAALLDQALDARAASLASTIDALKLQYPDYAADLEARYLARAALGQEVVAYREMQDEGVISTEIRDALLRDLEHRRTLISRPPRLDLRLKRADLVGLVPIFANLGPERREALAALMKPHLAVPGERIMSKGERGETMYFISSGAVEVAVGASPVRLGSGAFFGEMALLYDRPRNADITALGYCQLLELSRRDFERLMDSDESVRRAIRGAAEARAQAQARGGVSEG